MKSQFVIENDEENTQFCDLLHFMEKMNSNWMEIVQNQFKSDEDGFQKMNKTLISETKLNIFKSNEF